MSATLMHLATVSQPGLADWATSGEFLGAVVGCVISGCVAIIVVLLNQRSEARNKDDELFGKAFRAVMDWTEMPYRSIRSRDANEQTNDLRLHFHQLHEEIQFHRGWISFRSKKLGVHYERFEKRIREAVAPFLQNVENDPMYLINDLKKDMANVTSVIEKEVDIFREAVRKRRGWLGWYWELKGYQE